MATARLLLGSTPYIISTLGQTSVTTRGVTSANQSTTTGVRLAIPDDGTRVPSFAYDEAPDVTSLVVLICIDGGGSESTYQTRLAAVEAQLAPKYRTVTLEYDTGYTFKTMAISAGGYSSVRCSWRVIGSTSGSVLVCTFIGEKAIVGEGSGSSGSALNPTGLEDQIRFSYTVDERGINAVYATALLHGTAGSAFSSSSGALKRGQAWLDLMEASPPSFVPSHARFVPGAVQWNGQNEEATIDCAWFTSDESTQIVQMSAQVRTATYAITRVSQMLDVNAGGSGYEIECRVDITYVTQANTGVETATAITATLDADTVETDARLALANALSAAGVSSLTETEQPVLDFESSGAEATVTFRGIADGAAGITFWEETRTETDTYTHGSIVTYPDGTDEVHEIADPFVRTYAMSYRIESTTPVTRLPSLPSSYKKMGGGRVLPRTVKSADGTILKTVYEGSFSGRKIRGAGDGGGGAADLDASFAELGGGGA